MKRNLIIIFCLLLGLSWYTAISAAINNPKEMQAHLEAAEAYEAQGIYVDAITEYEAALIYEPENLEISMKIANAYLKKGEYTVGAVVKSKSGRKYTGCNIENHGIMSICAERVAFTKAISEGEKEFEYIVVCAGQSEDELGDCVPCGYCRQFMSEFVNEDFKIITITKDKKISEYNLKDLLPYSFKL